MFPHGTSGTIETGHFETRQGDLVLVPEGRGLEIRFDWVDGQSWTFEREPSLPQGTQLMPGMDAPKLNLGDDDLALMTGCDVNDIPRLVGETSVSMRGTVMHFTLRLLLVDFGLIYGFQEVRATARGMPVVERRPFVMTQWSW